MNQLNRILDTLQNICTEAENNEWDTVADLLAGWEKAVEEQFNVQSMVIENDEDRHIFNKIQDLHKRLLLLSNERHQHLYTELTTLVKGDRANLAYKK